MSRHSTYIIFTTPKEKEILAKMSTLTDLKKAEAEKAAKKKKRKAAAKKTTTTEES